MRVLFWYCENFSWTPAIKTLEQAPDADMGRFENVVVAFIHVEPQDVEEGSRASKKLLKNLKWLAKKWQTDEAIPRIILHSFTHLGEEKAEPDQALALINQVEERLNAVDFLVQQTPYGYFLDLNMNAKGHPLARVYKQF